MAKPLASNPLFAGIEDSKTIRKELDAFDPTLTAKPEVIVLTKSDLVTPEEIEKKKKKLKTTKREILTVSVNEKTSLKKLNDSLIKILKN